MSEKSDRTDSFRTSGNLNTTFSNCATLICVSNQGQGKLICNIWKFKTISNSDVLTCESLEDKSCFVHRVEYRGRCKLLQSVIECPTLYEVSTQ